MSRVHDRMRSRGPLHTSAQARATTLLFWRAHLKYLHPMAAQSVCVCQTAAAYGVQGQEAVGRPQASPRALARHSNSGAPPPAAATMCCAGYLLGVEAVPNLQQSILGQEGAVC